MFLIANIAICLQRDSRLTMVHQAEMKMGCDSVNYKAKMRNLIGKAFPSPESLSQKFHVFDALVKFAIFEEHPSSWS
jgi:hypothetical protein